MTRRFLRVAAAVPRCRVADPVHNTEQIMALIERAHELEVAAVAFPELCLTGYTARDLLLDTTLLTAVDHCLGQLREASTRFETTLIIGAPLEMCSRLYNCAVVIDRGAILGVVPKSFIPRSGEFEESRWFRSGAEVLEQWTTIAGEEVPFGADLIFRSSSEPFASFGVELCEDLWHLQAPSNTLFTNGAAAVFNLSASNFLVGKAETRRLLAKSSALRGIGGYVYVAAGPTESSTDLAFDADAFICERDEILAQSVRFARTEQIICSDLDLTALSFQRRKNQAFGDAARQPFRIVNWQPRSEARSLSRDFSKFPFLPLEPEDRRIRNWEIFEIQSNALATRMQAIGSPKLVLGLSGGIDSTHAALVCIEALKICQQPLNDLICITMPGFGSSETTKASALRIGEALGVGVLDLSISDVAARVLAQIEHPVANKKGMSTDDVVARLRAFPDLGDTTFENVQARLRTLLLMSLANQHNGLVIGTGDLSEKALGWSTFAGDQIAMYDVNAGVPKTVIQEVMKWVVEHRAQRWGEDNVEKLRDVLAAVIETPISPELLPPGTDGEVAQLTEVVLGPYVVHDFILFHFHVYSRPFSQILDLAHHTFRRDFDVEVLKDCAKTFVRRFFTQQFKRSCTPDGPKVLPVGLSPRGDWRMPSDATSRVWLDDIDKWQPVNGEA